MAQQHELLAVEKTSANALAAMMSDTLNKFGKTDQYYKGAERTLRMHGDGEGNRALERAGHVKKELITTVPETLDYLFKQWSKHEDILLQKNTTNQQAKANLEFRGTVIASDVPVEHLLGLEGRLEGLRKVLMNMPTLDSSRSWELDVNASMRGVWKDRVPVEIVKTEKKAHVLVLHEGNDKHPPQVKEMSSDLVVGLFTETGTGGSATPRQKADILAIMDDLLSEVKKARMRANCTPVADVHIGSVITNLLLQPLLPQS